jgi:hypothetical protein
MTLIRLESICLSVLFLAATITIACAQSTTNPAASGNTTNPISGGNSTLLSAGSELAVSPAFSGSTLSIGVPRNSLGLPCTGGSSSGGSVAPVQSVFGTSC